MQTHPGSAGFQPASKEPADPAAKTDSRPPILKTLALFAMPLTIGTYLWLSNPFKDELAKEVYSLSSLSPAQEYNIDKAARALDGRVLKPGELFGFNRAVGPRTNSRGYRAAPTYVGPDSPATAGGGICLVSSALYQAALIADLKIESRSPHLRTITSVTPGLDATVWYGRQDLKFRNSLPNPIQIKAECKNHNIYISILGERTKDMQPAELKTVLARRNETEVMVEVFRESNGQRKFITRDLYQINK